ncbi:uncharacterized protein LOC115627452 [Scaptodrosophila lebanonensis]|uniref:Uncharacterized protein LOC115627452 n=1 Tax=Drosophila lebanonensis TaxID=7225 RepID=A0A6J2TQN2_DROLE|nr:uncharacterized protein LOC115627452 [Scaptodrosophila lebanonensis]
MSDSDSDYEESEYILYADFKNHLAPQELKRENTAIKIIGIESENPVAEINGNIFKGNYDMAIGTNVFFQKDFDVVPGDPLFESTCRQQYKYVSTSTKVINFERIYIEKLPQEEEAVPQKTTNTQEGGQPADEPESLKLKINYKTAVKKFADEN